VTRADFKTLAWLAPLAAALMVLWLFQADRCLDTQVGNRFREMSPPAAAAIPVTPSEPGAVVVDNPSGIETCHHQSTVMHQAISWTLLAVIVLLIGLLSARFFQQRARARAALMTLATLSLALVFQLLAYEASILPALEYPGYLQLSILLAFFLGAATIAWCAAHVTLRLRARD